MAYHDKKVETVMFEVCSSLEQRYPEYRQEFQGLIRDVLLLEREHAIARINIVQKISEKIAALGIRLHHANRRAAGEPL